MDYEWLLVTTAAILLLLLLLGDKDLLDYSLQRIPPHY